MGVYASVAAYFGIVILLIWLGRIFITDNPSRNFAFDEDNWTHNLVLLSHYLVFPIPMRAIRPKVPLLPFVALFPILIVIYIFSPIDGGITEKNFAGFGALVLFGITLLLAHAVAHFPQVAKFIRGEIKKICQDSISKSNRENSTKKYKSNQGNLLHNPLFVTLLMVALGLGWLVAVSLLALFT